MKSLDPQQVRRFAEQLRDNTIGLGGRQRLAQLLDYVANQVEEARGPVPTPDEA
jgi:hypothetical protein